MKIKRMNEVHPFTLSFREYTIFEELSTVRGFVKYTDDDKDCSKEYKCSKTHKTCVIDAMWNMIQN